MNKLGFTEKEVGRMTYRKFNLLYTAYKSIFDLEMTMKLKQIRYCDLEELRSNSLSDSENIIYF